MLPAISIMPRRPRAHARVPRAPLVPVLVVLATASGGCERDRGAPDPDEPRASQEAAMPARELTCPQGTQPQQSVRGVTTETACVRPDGTRHGPIVAHFDGGRLAMKGQYQDGREVGTWTWHDRGPISKADPHVPGPKIMEGSYQDGRRVGTWFEWAPDGTMTSRVTYEDDKPVGVKESWWPDGKKQSEIPFVNGKEHGTVKRYHHNGQLSEQGELREGKRVGRWTSWHENGQKQWEGEYLDDKKEGAWTWWDESGAITKECEYRDEQELTCKPG